MGGLFKNVKKKWNGWRNEGEKKGSGKLGEGQGERGTGERK